MAQARGRNEDGENHIDSGYISKVKLERFIFN